MDYMVRECQLGFDIITAKFFNISNILNVNLFSWSTDVTSTDPVSAKGKTKEVYCCDIVVLIVLFDVSDAWRTTMWRRINILKHLSDEARETISISWLLFSPLPKLGQLSGHDVSWTRESLDIVCRFAAQLCERPCTAVLSHH